MAKIEGMSKDFQRGLHGYAEEKAHAATQVPCKLLQGVTTAVAQTVDPAPTGRAFGMVHASEQRYQQAFGHASPRVKLADGSGGWDWPEVTLP